MGTLGQAFHKASPGGQIITSEMNLEALFPLIVQHTNGIMDSQAKELATVP